MAERLPPERRRSVVILDSGARRTIRRDPDLVDLLDDPETQFVSIAPEEADDLTELLRTQGLLRLGTLVVQSPYNPDRYVPLDTALEEFTVEKFLLLAQLAKLLGAKKVTFEDARADSSTAQASGETNVKYSAVEVGTSASRKLESSLRQRLKGEHIFPGGAPDVTAAKKFLADKQLAGDPQLASLIELRSGDNALLSREIIFNGTRESSGNVAAALRVRVGLGAKLVLGNLAANAHQSSSGTAEVDVSTRIEF